MTDLPNDNRFADLTKVANTLGGAAAKGADALPQLATAITNAAYQGVIGEEKEHTLNGEQVDAAAAIYATYKKASGKKQFADYSGGGDTANISKLRAFVKLGLHPHCDGPALLTKVSPAIDTVKKAGAKVLSPYPAMIQVARAAVKLDREMTDDEVLDAVQPAEKEDPTLDDYLKGVEKKLEKLIAGEAPGGLKCQDDRVITAYEKIKDMRTFVAHGAEMAEFLAKAEALGFDLTQRA